MITYVSYHRGKFSVTWMGDPGKREIHVRYGKIKGRYGAIGEIWEDIL
jgi:hypothetical protein